MEEKKIEITKNQLNKATMYLFKDGELKTLVQDNPSIFLLVPIIAIELWKILSENKE